jgi:hypothetical protein
MSTTIPAFWQSVDVRTLTTAVRPSLTTRALVRPNTYFQTLYDADLLCYVCQERPWTQQARWCSALICEWCAEGEPEPDNDEEH